MSDPVGQALAAARALRASSGFSALPAAERAALERDLARVEHALHGADYRASTAALDPYAVPLETPAALVRGPFAGAPVQSAPAPQPAPAPPPQQARPAGTEVIGERARQTLDAVDFPSFVAGLIQGTFQAIVDSTTQQIREYAKLVASLAQTVDGFSRSNVSPNQVRDWFAQRYPADLLLVLPKAGETGSPRLSPRRRSGEPPEWLAEFGLDGEELTQELVEGPLLEAGRNKLGEERLQTLATMVLMGVNRIVVSDGEIKARLQFHASAREAVKADINADAAAIHQAGIASRPTEAQTAVQTMVSTVSVNAQADIAVRANLVGEVAIKFRSETFNLERFADSQAIELINRHSRLKQSPAAAPAAIPAPQAAP
jgi:hypothetical protein